MAARGAREAPARMEMTEPMEHARQPRSSMSRLTSSAEISAAEAEAEAARGGGAAPLMLAVERRGRRRSSELSGRQSAAARDGRIIN
jgi:hypothetical protein